MPKGPKGEKRPSAASRRKALPHSRLDGLYRNLGLAQQRQPARHVAAPLVSVGHLVDQVDLLADQVVEKIAHDSKITMSILLTFPSKQGL